MLTLSQATADSRTVLKIFVIVIGGVFSLLVLFRVLIIAKDALFPSPPPPPTVSFGVLPKIAFPQSATRKKLSFAVDTLSGDLPVLPDRAYVNRINGYSRGIFDLDTATQRASKIGFLDQGIKLSDTTYRWNDNSSLQRELTMNIITGDFILTSLFTSDPQSISAANLKNDVDAKQAASSFLGSMNEIPSDLDDSKTSTVLYRVDHQALVPATSLSNTQIIGVYFFQNDVNGLPIMYPVAQTSTMNVIVGSGDFDPAVVAADFSHQNILNVSATYPIISAQAAFDDLKSGQAYISTYNGGDKINIENVFLAYYLGEEKQSYLMPIIVFQGSNGFYAYVSAVTGEWIKN